MRKIFTLVLMFLCSLSIMAARDSELLTRAEASNFTETANQEDILLFINTLQERSQFIRTETLLITNEGRLVPMVIIGNPLPAGPASVLYDSRPVVYIQANIHAGEVAGSAAVQILMREMLLGNLKDIPEKLILIIVPNFNADGNDKISTLNRPYIPTPEKGVGVRHNSQNLDLNRDYVKVDARETAATIEKIFNTWNPLIVFDMHTTNGSFHKHNMTYSSGKEPAIAPAISKYMWDKFFPSVAEATLNKDKLLTLPYGNFDDDLQPEKGWYSFPDIPRVCASYISIRGRFSVLCEAYSYADFKTRVNASHNYLLRSLEYIINHSDEMKKIAEASDKETASMALIPYEKRPKMPLQYKAEQEGSITIHSYKVEKKKEDNVYPRYSPLYDQEVTYTVPLMTHYVPTLERTYAAGYIITSGAAEVAAHLIRHGILVERIEKSTRLKFKRFYISEIKKAERLNQGHWQTNIKGNWKEEEGIVEKGDYFVTMAQPFARLIAVLMEPDSPDSLLLWNFFDSWLVPQWSNELLPYPVLRIDELQPLIKHKINNLPICIEP